MNEFKFENINQDIYAECKRQDEKWGADRNHMDDTWLSILTEEVGESAQALLHDAYGGSHNGTLRKELIQVAAVVYQWIDCLDRNGYDES